MHYPSVPCNVSSAADGDTGPFFTHKCPQKSAVYVHHLSANPIKEARGFCGIFTRQSSGPSCSALETSSDNLLLRRLFTGQINWMTEMTVHFLLDFYCFFFIVFLVELKSNFKEKLRKLVNSGGIITLDKHEVIKFVIIQHNGRKPCQTSLLP